MLVPKSLLIQLLYRVQIPAEHADVDEVIVEILFLLDLQQARAYQLFHVLADGRLGVVEGGAEVLVADGPALEVLPVNITEDLNSGRVRERVRSLRDQLYLFLLKNVGIFAYPHRGSFLH